MANPIDAVRAALSTTPREREYLELDTTGWSDADRAAAAAELLDAALSGDWRVPAALGWVMSIEQRRETLEDLLRTAPPRVRIEAGWELRTLTGYALQEALGEAVLEGELDGYGAQRAVDLLLQSDGGYFVIDLISRATDEDVRTVLISRLWEYRQFDIYPAVWWSGLGLLKRTLELPIPSFRDPALEQFEELLNLNPLLAGYPAVEVQPVPPALRAAMDDVEHGQGAVPESLLTPLSDDEQRGLLVFAAEKAVDRLLPRGLIYVGLLGGADHRGLIEWATTQPVKAFADAAKDVLNSFP